MPARIVKESICTSESMAKLSWFEQVFFERLIVSVDDYGRMDARTAVIRGRLFPLDAVTVDEIQAALLKMSDVEMVTLYEVNGKPYLQLTNWDKYQNPRAKSSKCPAPDDENAILQTSANICKQMQANAPVFDIRNSYSIFDIRNSDLCTEQNGDAVSSMPQEPAEKPKAVIFLTLNDKSEYPITEKQVTEWESLYPAVDVMQQLRAMKGWLDANTKGRKTKSGILRFVNAWLSKEQNRGGVKRSTKNSVNKDYSSEDDFLAYAYGKGDKT